MDSDRSSQGLEAHPPLMGSRVTSSIHISPMSVLLMILKSRASEVASHSVLKTRSTLTQRPPLVRHSSCAPSLRIFHAVGVSLYCAIRARHSPSVPGAMKYQ